ncbi:MAG: cysteine methyltransferase [Candidatus Hydrogenedentota bacterium]|nr:MAG: cysteine methyltransferase [Candidatus Hydrogenedentota bacterium]
MSESTIYYSYTKSPCGEILLACNEEGLTHIHFQDGKYTMQPKQDWIRDAKPLCDAKDQLLAYFEGTQMQFDLPLAPAGTPFQLRVWEALKTIPCGKTVSYTDIARSIEHPTAVRAVGSANGRNPLPIVIPCHRVIGSDGKLRGYAGGLAIKQKLLEHECAFAIESDPGEQLYLPA